MKRYILLALLITSTTFIPLPAQAGTDSAPVIAPAVDANKAKDIENGSFYTGPITGKCSDGTFTCHGEKVIIESLFLKIGGILSLLVGILAVFGVVINGIRYITSAGDPTKAKTARSGILAALIGVIIAILAYTFIHFAQVAGGFLSGL